MLGHYYTFRLTIVQCNENLIYVFSEKELRGLSPNIPISTFMSLWAINIFHDRPTYFPAAEEADRGNIIRRAHRLMNVEIGTEAA